MKRTLIMLAAVLTIVIGTAAPASAQPPPIDIVHSERLDLGETTLTVSFSEWPIQSHRSMDFTFEPEDGIAGHSGLLKVVSPSGDARDFSGAGLERRDDYVVLPRHPNARDVWGLDVVALPQEGTWLFEFTVEGPEGTATGVLPLEVGPPPGPPMELSWTIALLPWAVILPWLVYRWIRNRPIREPEESPVWSG